MAEGYNIQYIAQQQIDKQKWDNCIDNAPNRLVYAYTFYLDRMARNWDALVLNDYEVVMPLTWNKKYGISYLYQPFLTAQLGLFGKGITESLVEDFLQLIPGKFKLVEICLNSGNTFSVPGAFLNLRSNYVLALNKSYDELYQGYRDNIKRNIKKAVQSGCHAKKGFDVKEVIDLAVQQMRSYGEESSANVERFRDLYNYLHEKEMATTYGICSARNELIASCVFFLDKHRAYYILVGNHPDGRTIGASHMLIDEFIKDHAGENIKLDFEGSDIRNLAFFYSSFGAAHEVYPAIQINRLPFYLKWLKRR